MLYGVIGLLIGFTLGSIFGIAILCILAVASKHDKKIEAKESEDDLK